MEASLVEMPQSKFCNEFKVASSAVCVCVCVLSCDIGAAPESELPRTLLWLTESPPRRNAAWSEAASQAERGHLLF